MGKKLNPVRSEDLRQLW